MHLKVLSRGGGSSVEVREGLSLETVRTSFTVWALTH